MAYSLVKKMIDNGLTDWSWPFAYGILAASVRSYLRGDRDRVALTAQFAVIQLEQEAFSNAVASGLSTKEAMRHVVELLDYHMTKAAAEDRDSQPAADEG